MTTPADIKIEYKSQTYAEVGSQAQLTAAAFGYASIVSPDGNYLYYVADSDLNIVDISDPANPSSAGTATVVDGNCGNQAITGLAFDSTGRYLYVPNGTTSLYTLDLDLDPESPALDNTLTIPTAAVNNHHVIVLGDSVVNTTDRLYILCDTTYQQIDISTPDTPTLGTSEVMVGVSGADVNRGYLAQDRVTILFPELSGGAGKIFSFYSLDATFGQTLAIDLPDFGAETISVSGALNFDSSVNDARMWFVGTYSSSGSDSYFWMVYDFVGIAGFNSWAGNTALSVGDVAVGADFQFSGGGDLTPSHYLSNEPYDTLSWGIADSQIVVEKTKSTSGEGAFISFYLVSVEELFPQLVIKEGSNRTEQLGDFNYFTSVSVSSGLVAGIGQAQTVDAGGDVTVFGAVYVHVPTAAETTVVGWVDLTSDVRQADGIDVSVGIRGDSIRDRIAQTGSMSFRLNNHETEGKYTPGHANQATNFQIGAPVRLQLSRAGSSTPLFTKFIGRIESLTPLVDLEGGNVVGVTCVDAMDILSRARVKGLTVRTGITAKRVVEITLNAATGLPITTDVTNSLDETPDAYDFSFLDIEDDEVGLLAEIARAAESERGFFYPAYQHDDLGSDGGFRFESRDTRINSPVFNTTVLGDGTLSQITPEHSADVVYNRVQVRVFPREVDSAATTILFTLQNSPKLKRGESITFTAPYRDPSGRSTRVSGTEMQPPIANTDFKFTGRGGGGGGNLTDNISVLVEFGGSSAEVTVTNNTKPAGFLSTFQLKGKGLYSYEPVTATKRHLVSIVKYGLSDVTMELPYIEDLLVAGEVGQSVLDSYAEVQTFIRQAELVPSRSSDTLDAFIDGEIGDKFFVENDVLSISRGTTIPFILGTSALGTEELADGDAVYVIHSIQFKIGDDGLIPDATWGLFPATVRL